jgi:hypothetical protein
MSKAKEEYYKVDKNDLGYVDRHDLAKAKNYIKKLEEDIKQIEKIANNTLYFDDDSDYDGALWVILSIVNPEIFKDTYDPELHYIEEAPSDE